MMFLKETINYDARLIFLVCLATAPQPPFLMDLPSSNAVIHAFLDPLLGLLQARLPDESGSCLMDLFLCRAQVG